MASEHTQTSDVDVFISYSRRDIDFVDRLQPALAARGVRAAVDRTDIEKGEAWWARIEELIRESDVVVFVLSPDAVASETCQCEVDFAESLNKRFAPIVVREFDDKRVPPALARLNYVHFTGPAAHDPQVFDAAIDDLVRALRIDLAWVREHTRLGTLAARWDAQRRANELTLRGSELKRAETWAITQPAHAPAPTTLHHAFITASRQAATRRQRLLTSVTFAGLVVAVGLASVALWQWDVASNNARIAKANEELAKTNEGLAKKNEERAKANEELAKANEELAKTNEKRAIHERNIALARQLGAQAQALLSQGIGAMQSLGVLLAVEGTRLYPNAEATAALQQAVRLRAPINLEASSCEFCIVGYYSAFSPDNKRLAVAGRPARVIDVSSRETIMTLGPSGPDAVSVTAIAYDPTGEYIATAAAEHDVTLWSAKNGTVVSRIRSPGASSGPITFSREGDLLAVAADRLDIVVLNVPSLRTAKRLSGQPKGRFAAYATSRSLSFDADGKMLSQTIDEGNEVTLWMLRDGKSRTIKLDARADFATFGTRYSRNMLAVGVAGTVRLLDPETGAERARLGQTESRTTTSVAFGEDGRIVGAVGWDAPARVWNISSREEIHRFEHERGISGMGRIASMSISPDGRSFATHGDDVLRIWQSDQPQLKFENVREPPSDPGLLKLAGLTGQSTESQNRRVCLEWKATTVRALDCRNRQQVFYTATTKQPIRLAAVSQTGRYTAILDQSGQVLVLDAAGNELRRIKAEDTTFITMDERQAILALLSPKQGVQYMSLTGGWPVPPPLAGDSRPIWARFSDSGAYLLSTQDGTLIVAHDVATGRTLARAVHDRPVTSVLWLEEPRYFATASKHDGTARVWDTQADTLVLQWHLLTNLDLPRFGVSSDGRYLYFAGGEHRNNIVARPRVVSRYELWRPDDLIQAACLTVNRELTDDEWQRYLPQSMQRRPTCPARKSAAPTAPPN